MSFDLATAIVGSDIDAFTSPGYILADDVAPNSHSLQAVVTGTTGTQAGVTNHSVARPFTITVERPANLRVLGTPNPVTGVVSNVPRNVYVIRTRKGVTPLAGQPSQVMLIETKVSVPAGSDTADIANISGAISAHLGFLSGNSAGLDDTAGDGVI